MPIALAALICFLCGLTDLKLFEIQSVEVVILGALAISFMGSRSALSLSGPTVIIDVIPRFLWMFFFVFVGSLLSLRLNFYPPSGVSALKMPPVASFVKFVEVVISVSALFIVALAVRNNADNFRRLLSAYLACAYLNATWGLVSWLGWVVGFDLPGVTVTEITRVRGFFVEGGPFGLYMVSAILLQIIRYKYLKYISGRAFIIGISILTLALIGSQSKAAALLAVSLTALYCFLTRRIVVMVVCGIVVSVLFVSSDLFRGLDGYYENYSQFQTAARLRPDDTNLVMGRLMASILLPRIIEMHPILGIGIGNYGLVRNDPAILRGLPGVNEWDLPGLGLLGYCAELGIPLTFFVLWLYAYPLIASRRSRVWITLISAYPVLAALFGVQLTFAYPWVVAGIAMAAVAIDRKVMLDSAQTPNPPRASRSPRLPAGVG